MSWDFDFENESFGDFDSVDDYFDESLGTSFALSFILQQNSSFSTSNQSPMKPQPIQQIPKTKPSQASQIHYHKQGDLAEENNQLRQFFKSLKEKADQAESLNQTLKCQLADCRNWFKDAMFTGFRHSK